MNGIVRAALTVCFVSLLVEPGFNQVVMQPTPLPTVTAENEHWYLNGDPIAHAGNLYYPAGAEIFFNASEMVRSGFYQGIPLFTRTTIEPYSIVYVPLAGGRMQPYERPRSGELTGTAGSTPTSLPTPRDTVAPAGLALQAAGPPTQTTTVIPVQVPRPDVAPPPEEIPFREAPPQPAGTSGRVSATRPPTHTSIGGTPRGTNSIFIEFQNERWYPIGPAQAIDMAGLVQVGEVNGFRVLAGQRGSDVVYVPVTRGGSLAVAYSKSKPKAR